MRGGSGHKGNKWGFNNKRTMLYDIYHISDSDSILLTPENKFKGDDS
jgi:hypothetical protein